MKFKINTYYAIAIVIYLSEKQCKVSSEELSKILIIPRGCVFKVLKMLQDSDIVASYIGAGGGFVLKKSPKDIIVYDIVDATESDCSSNQRYKKDEYQNYHVTAILKTQYFYILLKEHMESLLKSITVEELLALHKDC